MSAESQVCTSATAAVGELCQAIRGVTFPASVGKAHAFTGSVACLTTAAIQSNLAWDARRYIPRSFCSRPQFLQDGDILISTANSKSLIGKNCLVNSLPETTTFGAFVTVLRPTSRVISKYLRFTLQTTNAMMRFRQLSSHTTGISNLRVSNILDYRIPLPSLQQQRRIVAMLDRQMALAARVFGFVQERRGLIDDFAGATLREAFHSIVPLSIDPNEAERPPTKWRWARLIDVARLESGHTPSRRHPDWWGGKIPWLALPDIRALHGTVAMTTTENTNRVGIANSSARVLPKDTVALSRTASVGFVTIMGRPMATSQDFVNWVCGPALEPWFLLYALMASRDRLLSLSSGAIHKTIYMPTVEAFHVCMPSIETQRIFVKKIHERLALNERMRQRVAEEAEATAAMPQIILRQVFGEAA